MPAVTITDVPLSAGQLLQVVAGARVELGDGARARIRASRAVVDQALAGDAPVYGLNTGVGSTKDVRLGDEAVRRAQRMLVLTHAGGLGPPLRTELVRAAMAVRLNGLARGGSGASPAVADTLAAMLNAGVHPVVPATGSVGAGDLGQMAGIAQVAIGLGTAEHGGSVLPGAEALARAGIEPLVLAPKDGLALIAANGVSVGHGALVLARAAELAAVADVAFALSLEATAGNPSVVLPAVAQAKPYAGQVDTCASMRAALAGSRLLAAGASLSVQDPLSFRVAPQVHGAFRELAAFTTRAVETELNAMTDNPLAVPDGGLVHNGNFHPMVMALAFDALRTAVAHVGQLSERRLSHLWDAALAGLTGTGPAAGWGSPPALVGMALRYPAAAAAAELRQLAAPATLDVPPLDRGVEDHATGAPVTVRRTEDALGLLADLLAVELLLARDVLAIQRAPEATGAGARAALAAVEAALAEAPATSPDQVHRELLARLAELGRPAAVP